MKRETDRRVDMARELRRFMSALGSPIFPIDAARAVAWLREHPEEGVAALRAILHQLGAIISEAED